MCIFRAPSMPAPAAVAPTPVAPAPVAPPPPAPPAPAPAYGTSSGGGMTGTVNNPVMQNVYDPSNPESGMAEEKGATLKKAQGTSQLRIDLDPVIAIMA